MPKGSMSSLEEVLQRLETLEEERAILRAMYQYGHSIDYGKEQEWVDCFTEDGAFDVRRREGLPGSGRVRHQGRAALAAYISKHTRAPNKYHKHMLVEPVITLKGAEASVASYFARLDESAAGEPYILAFGRYHDKMVKCPDGKWRFRERIADIEALSRTTDRVGSLPRNVSGGAE
ncbi:MAG: nuclear transport factor 2 family protein [Chloroflexi bacterium]|nr:nuclear transport factor 2 family protein [Chloroflexota bacterium]